MKGIFLLYCLLSFSVNAQTTFNKILHPGAGIETGDNIIIVNDGYVVCGGGFLSALDGWGGIVLIKTDFDGNELWRKDHGKIGYVWNNGNSGSLIPSLQGGFAVAGYFVDTNSTDRNAALYKFDDEGNFEWMKVFGGSGDDYFSVCRQMTNGDYIMIGYTENFGDVDGSFYVVKTDSLGDLKWQKTYGGEDTERGNAVEITLDTNFLLAGGSRTFGPSSYNNYLIKTDTAGNTLWTATPSLANNRCGAGRSAKTSDGGFILGSCFDSLQSVYWAVSYIQKVNDTGAVVWRHFFEGKLGAIGTNDGMSQNYRQIITLENDEVVVVGEETYDMDSSYQYGWIIKLDKNGNKLWERLYSYPPIEGNALYAIKQTSDKGFICTGTGFEVGHSNSSCWLLKLDSLGCLSSTDCGIPTAINEPTVSLQNTSLQIVPNPARQNTIVAIKASEIPNKEVVIELHDLTGKRLHSGQTVLNVYGYGEHLLSRGRLTPGIYLVSVRSEGKVIGLGKVLFQ